MESDALASTTEFTSNKKWLNGWFAPKDHLWNHSLYWHTKPCYKCTWDERTYQYLSSLHHRPFFVYHHSMKMHFIFDSKTFRTNIFYFILFQKLNLIEFYIYYESWIKKLLVEKYHKWYAHYYHNMFCMFRYICYYWISQINIESTAGFLLIFLLSNFFVTLHRMMLP